MNSTSLARKFFSLFFSLSAFLVATCDSVHVVAVDGENYIQTMRQSDGELVTKIRFSNVTATQTSIAGFSLIQLTNGTELIQIWIVDNDMMDCEFDNEADSVSAFLSEFNGKIRSGQGTQCAKETSSCSNGNRTDAEDMNMTVTLRRISGLPPQLSFLNNTELLVKKCRQLHEKILKRYSSSGARRWKRADILFPGTNWCGSGSTSKSFMDLGQNLNADRCCRDHDHCKHTIAPFSSKYRLFNYRFHTVSHCDCDERFRSCLKRANTGATNLVGKLFFNVVQTKCFTFKREAICKKRSWWGKCLKKRKARHAYFRNGLAY